MTHRGTILSETGHILSHEAFAGDQFVLRVQAPGVARRALPGSFVHLQCAEHRPMRRPISIMRTSPEDGWVDFLYKVVGDGTRELSERRVQEPISLLGPIGRPFQVHPDRSRPLLIGGGVGMPPMVFLADSLRGQSGYRPFVILGSEVPFPFRAEPSRIVVGGLPADCIAAMPLLEERGIPSRLASQQGYPGCFEGYVTDLARPWLEQLDDSQRRQVEVFSCGPTPMLKAVARLAAEFGLPCQVSLEEYMACAVGGCAGCVVEVHTAQGKAMKRVCVDGPVFDASSVFP